MTIISIIDIIIIVIIIIVIEEKAKAVHGWSELDLVSFKVAGMSLPWKVPRLSRSSLVLWSLLLLLVVVVVPSKSPACLSLGRCPPVW